LSSIVVRQAEVPQQCKKAVRIRTDLLQMPGEMKLALSGE